MRSNTFIYCIIVAVTILITNLVIEESSSPVEEMYHKQLVVTLDSILYARFDTNCYKEDTDTDNTNTFSTRFNGILRLWNDIKFSICLFPLAVLRLNMLYDKLISYDTKALRINFYFCKIFKLL